MFFLVAVFISIGTVFAQKKVSGIVLDNAGEPFIGASILVKGTSRVAATDVEGHFTITVDNDNSIIIVRCIGYKTVEVPAKRATRIVLHEDETQLDEVMVVAYGTTKKASFTGSASTVSSKDIGKLQVSNVTKALEGAAPGVQVAMQSGQPGSNATVRIRGIGSINASSSPLYVVDGVPYDGSIAAINSADIESVTVLKDAASTSLYGSRASNGVIVITTKKGSNNKTRVSFEARAGVNSRGISEYDIMKEPGEYFLTYWKALKNTFGSGESATARLYTTLGYNPYANTANDAIVDKDGNLTKNALLYHDNWAEEAFRNSLRQEYTLSLQGGSDKSTHYLSLGYLNDGGIISNSDYKRYSIRTNGDYKVNNFIRLTGGLSYARSEQNSLAISALNSYGNTFAFTQNIAPIYPVYAYDSNGARVYDNGKTVYDFGDGTYGKRPYLSRANVVATDEANKKQQVRDNITVRAGVDISFLKNFKFQANLGYDVTLEGINEFATPSFADAAARGGDVEKERNRYESYTVNELLTYNKKFAGKHKLDVLVGHENYKYTNNDLYAYKTNVFESTVDEFDNAIIMQDMKSYTREHTIESFLGRVNYDYDDKYYFSASLRRDGSSRFAEDNRWGTFWSVGGSWRISQEDFMRNTKTWLDNLTIRSSYGSVGNDDIYYPTTTTSNYYAYKTQYKIENSNKDHSVSKYYEGNPHLTWETSYNFNVGASAAFWNNLLNVDVEFYNKRTEDMLYNVPQAPSSGDSYLSQNALTMNNRGVDFSVGVNVPLSNKDMHWNITLTGSHYRNKVTGIPKEKEKDGITHLAYYNIRPGKSVYDFYTYRYAGVDANGRSTWYAEDNAGNTIVTANYAAAKKDYVGTALPDLQGGLSTSFTWKNVDFSLGTNFQLGGKIMDEMYMGLMHAGSSVGHNFHRDMLNAWDKETNPNSNIPKLNRADQNANAASDRFLIGADFFNIRNITLGYTFPKTWLKKATINSARAYIVADNVALFSKRQGLDPRQYIHGLSRANYSTIRTVSVGVSLTF